MNCSDVSDRLGTHLDGELSTEDRDVIRGHLEWCERCRTQFQELQDMVRPLKASATVKAPPDLWDAIEAKLDADVPKTISIAGVRAERNDSKPGAPTVPGGGVPFRRWPRPFLVAAAVLAPIGFVMMFLQLSSPKSAYAEEAVIDFRPLLAGIETDFEAAMADFLEHHKARPIGLSEAGRHVPIRVHPSAPLPDDMALSQLHLLTLGKKRGLLFQFAGPKGKLVISQCPAGVRKEHGERHCLPCSIGSRPEAEVVHVGKWRLVHLPSAKGCICILSTLDDDRLANVLETLEIEF